MKKILAKFQFLQLFHKYFQNPKTRPIILVLSLIYLVSPFDVIPEVFIPFFGYLDDFFLIIMLVREGWSLLVNHILKSIFKSNFQAKNKPGSGKIIDGELVD